MKSTSRFEQVDVNLLVPYARNARTHSKEQILQLRSSLREFGFVNPILITADYSVISGHGRLEAAKAEGIAAVPCVFVEHLTEAQKKAYILADNRLAQSAGWDEELLALELGELKELNFDMNLTGFDIEEIEKLFAAGNPEVEEDDFDVDAAEREPVLAQHGDVWTLGRHRLLCGDSTVSADVQRLMNGEKARFVFIDPPWNVDYGSDTKHPCWKPRQIMNDNMSAEQFGAFLLAAFKCIAEVSAPGTMLYCVMSAQEWGSAMITLHEAGFHWSSTIIWVKDSLVLSRKDYHTQYEPIWYGWYAPNGEPRLCPLADRKQSDVWQIPRPKKSELHPTMKPLTLVARAIMNSSRPGDIVLDTFGGSGSTLLSAEQTGRSCRMMELDPKYVSVILRRYAEFKGNGGADISVKRDGEVLSYACAVNVIKSLSR